MRIALSKAFAERTKLQNGSKFDLLIGTDDEVGVVRLVGNPAGILNATQGAKGAFTFFCGHVEQFGTIRREKHYCAAELVEADTITIEVTLPPWAVDQG